MQTFMLCADDYAYRPAVSAGILDLIKAHRLSATSCMVNMPDWPQAAQQLKPFQDQIDIGLHFNLTEGAPLAPNLRFAPNEIFPDIKNLLIKSHLLQLSINDIKRELRAQIEAFKQAMGRWPAFIDGHQHVHHLPVIRQALLAVYQEYFPNREAYLRISANGFWAAFRDDFPKNLIISMSGANTLRRLAKKQQIPHNKSFGGVYDFSPRIPYARHFQRFLQQIKNNGLIMCHPGQANEDKTDPIAKARAREYAYFMSEQFIEDCRAVNKALTKFHY